MRAEAIVVLGCRLNRRRLPSRALQRRIALGIRLYRDGAAPLLLLSGGGGEAEAMHRIAIAAGVPTTSLICEDRSANTVENAVYAARLLHERGLMRILLVSHRTHLPRAAMLFRLSGLDVACRAGVPAGSAVEGVAAVLYEAIAVPRSLLRMALLSRVSGL